MIFGYIDDIIDIESQKNIANGIAGLDNNSRLDPTVLPPLAITSVSVVQTIVDRNNLIVETGDVCKVVANNTTYIFDGINWIELSASLNMPIILNDLNDVTITNPTITQAIKYNGTEFINEKIFLSDVDDLNIVSPADKDVLAYQNGKFENRPLVIGDITNLQNQLNAKVNVAEYTNTGDLTFADGPNSVGRLPISTPGRVLKVSTQNVPEWADSVSSITQLSDVVITNPFFSQVLFYNNIDQPPRWENRALTTDFVPEPQVANPQNQYFLPQRVTDYLLNILPDNAILYRSNGQILALTKGTEGNYLRSNLNDISYSKINSDEIQQGTTNLFYNDTFILNYLNTILTQNETIFIRRNNTLTQLTLGGNNQFLGVNNGVLAYMNLPPQITNLSGLNDVNIVAIANGQYLRYNSTSSKWENVTITSDSIPQGSVNLYASNSNITSSLLTILTTSQDILIRNAVGNIARLGIGAVGTVLKNVGGVLTWDTDISGKNNLSELNDVAITTITNNQYIRYNSTSSKWENVTITSDSIPQGTTNKYYSDASVDTYLKTILTTSGDILFRNASNQISRIALGPIGSALVSTGVAPTWVNISLGLSQLNDVNVTHASSPLTEGQVLMWARTEVGNNLPVIWRNRFLQISHITNLQTTLDGKINNTVLTTNGDIIIRSAGTPTRLGIGSTGQILTVVGGLPSWVTPSSTTTLAALTDVNLTAIANGQYLRYNSTSSKWENVTITSDSITQGSVNLYYTDARVSTYLLTILTTNESILIRRNGAIARLPSPVNNNDVLKYNTATGRMEWGPVPSVTPTLSILTDVQIMNDPIQAKSFLMYNGTSSGIADFWTDTLAEIADITGLETALNDKINSNVMTNNGDLITRSSGVPSRIAIGTQGQLLTVGPSGLPIWLNAPTIANTLADLTDVTITTPTTGQVLYKSNGDWVNQSLAISDVTNLQTQLDAKLINTFTANGQLLVGAGGGGVYQTLNKGTTGQVLTANNTTISWEDPVTGKQNLSELNDCTITTPANNQFLWYNGVSSKWVNANISTDNITEGTTNKYASTTNISNYLLGILSTPQDILIRNGSVIDRLGKGANNQMLITNNSGILAWADQPTSVNTLAALTGDVNIVTPANNQLLRYNNTNSKWENVSITTQNIPENTNMYFTFERVDTNLNNKYNAKGVIQIGTGNLSYTAKAAPTATYQVLKSDINNALNATGTNWELMSLDTNHFSNVAITNPTNTQALRYNTATTKWENSSITTDFPLRAPNGTTAAPSYSFANFTNVGMTTGRGGGDSSLQLVVGGVEAIGIGGGYIGAANGHTFLGLTGSLANPSFTIQSNPLKSMGIYGSVDSLSMNFSTGSTKRFSISNTAVKTENRLDIINTLIEDYRMRINNIFNSFDFQNSAGTTSYLKVDSGNDKVIMARNTWGMVYDNNTGIETNINANNTLIQLNLGDFINNATAQSNSANALVNYTVGTNQITILKAGTYLVNFSFSLFQTQGTQIVEIFPHRAADGGIYNGATRRFTVKQNEYGVYSSTFVSSFAANENIRVNYRCNEGAPLVVFITNFSFCVTNLMTT